MDSKIQIKDGNLIISRRNWQDLLKNPLYTELLEDLVDREELLNLESENEELTDWNTFKKTLKK